MAGKKVVEAVPVFGILVQIALKSELRVIVNDLIVLVRPGLGRAQKFSPFLGKLDQPASVWLGILQGIVVKSLPVQLLKRHVVDKIEVVQALVDFGIETVGVHVLGNVPRHGLCRPVDIIVIRLKGLRGVCFWIGVDLLCHVDRLLEQLLHFRLLVKNVDQLLCDRLMRRRGRN